MTEQVKAWCYRQCELQHATTIEDFDGMENAWEAAAIRAKIGAPLTVGKIQQLARVIDPVANPNGRFRTGPAVFMGGGSAVDADLIGGALDYLFTQLRVYDMTPPEFYRELMWIHPMKDGNGRLGALVYNILNGTIDNPVNPPEYK